MFNWNILKRCQIYASFINDDDNNEDETTEP